MTLLTIGGDLRYAYLTLLASSRSIEIAAIGFERSPFPVPTASLEDIGQAQAVILPNPWRSGLSLPYACGAPFTLNDVFSRMRRGSLLLLSDLCGMPSPPDGIRIADLSADVEYVHKNAHLTAEGAVCSAALHSGRALLHSTALVIGYGRIGARLAALLRAMGAETAVAVRRESVRLQIQADGHAAFSMEELPLILPRADFIFSTPPQTVLDEPLLRLIRPDALLMDLASPPYGFDLALAHSLSLRAVRENGLPGRYSPLSAGEALLEAVVRTISAFRKGD